MAGLFLSLEGIDGSGKTIQCWLLAHWLRARGRTVTACADPGGTPLGDQLRSLLLATRHDLCLPAEALLFMASRAQLTAEVIRPALDAGDVVIADRYTLSNVVYQGYAGGLDLELLRQAGRLATRDLEPDLTLVLDLDPALAATRRRGRSPDRFECKDAAYQAWVRAGYLAEARAHPERIRVIDASGDLDAVQQAINAMIPG
jgi:dTMP kinase